MRARDLPRSKLFLIRPLRIMLLSFRGFSEDKCQLRASALTFYSLLSIVPIVAMVFGIAKGFGIEKGIEARLLEQFKGQEAAVARVVEFSRALLENTKGGVIAGIGVAILFWTFIKGLSNIEESFNEIWGIQKARTLVRKISDYLSLLLVAPIFLVMSGTLTVAIASQVTALVEKITLLGSIAPLVFFMLKLLPYALLWALFTFIYIFMPNTKVHLKSAAIAGIISGTLFQIFQLLYINFQIGVAKHNAIYGSFAALPLFLFWLQASWLIVLLGAELSFAHQNVETYEFEPDSLRVSHSFKRLLSLKIVHMLVHHFVKGDPPLDEERITHQLELPIRLVRLILFELTNAGIISQVKTEDDRMVAYLPALDTDCLTIKYVLDALDQHGTDTIPLHKSQEIEQLTLSLKAFNEATERSPANKRLKDI